MTEMTLPHMNEIHYLSDNGLDSSGEGVEIAPSQYSTDSTVSMETEDSHDVISDSPIAGRNMSSNYHVAFSFLDKEEDIQEEGEQLPEQSDFGFEGIDGEIEEEQPSLVESTGIIIGDESNGSTAEELETAPFDSGTTDPGNTYEENRNQDYYQNGDEGIVGYTGLTDILTSAVPVSHRSYENWPIIEDNEELNKRRKSISRCKVSRVPVRQRAPLPLPRPSHLKQKPLRPPVPVPRKRRVSGRLRPSLRNTTSEGDMEQADEMGDDGEGDDGFVDGTEAGLAKRKTKKKLSVLIPTLPVISPPSSPSNVPISRRRTISRKNRVKPKYKKNSKPTLASADISTQETTTPGPNTSDSDNNNNEEVEPVTNSNHQQIEDIAEEDMSIRGAVVARRQPSYGSSSNGIGLMKLDSSSRSPSVESINKKTKAQNGKATAHPPKHLGPKQSNSSSSSGPVSRGGKTGSKSMEDSTTAPLSSETSDTSDNEKKRKTTPTLSGIPKLSPQTSRKATEQENQRPRATKGTYQSGKFVSKRLSVAAMINQFDTSDGQHPPSPTTKTTSPVTKRAIYSTVDKGAGKKPPPLNKPTSLSKPVIKPKPSSPIPKESSTSPVPSTVATVTKKPVQKTASLVKKDDKQLSCSTKQNESSDATKNQTKLTPPLPPKPKSPPATKQHQLPVKPSNGKTTSISSSSGSSLSSSSPSSISKSKSDDRDSDNGKKGKQSVVRKSSLTRASSNSSLSGKTSTTTATTTKTTNKLLGNNYRRSSPSTITTTGLQSNKVNSSSTGKPTLKNNKSAAKEKEITTSTERFTKDKSVLTSDNTTSNEEDNSSSVASSTASLTENIVKTKPSVENEAIVSLSSIRSKLRPINKPKPNNGHVTSEQSVSVQESSYYSKIEKRKPSAVVKPGDVSGSSGKLKDNSVDGGRATSPSVINKTNKSKPNNGHVTSEQSVSVQESSYYSKIEKRKPSAVVKPGDVSGSSGKVKDNSVDGGKATSPSVINKTNKSKPTNNKTTVKTKEEEVVDGVPTVNGTTTNSSVTDKNGGSSKKKIPDPLLSVALIKPSIRPQKSSPRRPPPDPPLSPPGGDKTSVAKQPRPRLRSPPPPPPVSPSKNKDTKPENNRESDCSSPRNYEEFVPSMLRSNSTASMTVPLPVSPVPQETRTKGEDSGNSNMTSYNARAYEDITIIPSVKPDQQTSSLPAGFLRTLSFSGIFSKKETNEVYSECSGTSSPIVPPPLPPRNYPLDDPVISLPTMLDPVDENDTMTSSLQILSKRMSNSAYPLSSGEDSETPPPLPSQPIPKRKGMLGQSNSPLLKRKPIVMSSVTSSPPVQRKNVEDFENVYEEIPGNIPGKRSLSSLTNSHYETTDSFIPKPRVIPNYSYSRDSSLAGSTDSIDGNRRFSASVCVSTTSGLSPVTLRRANSDKMKNPRIPLIITTKEHLGSHENGNSSLQRTSSMDILDDRMNQSVRTSLDDLEFSSGEEGDGGVLSPHQGLPQPPQNTFDLASDKDSISHKQKEYSEEEQEPLYQYINHLDFTSTPWMTRSTKIGNKEKSKKGSNQLEIARQLSVNHRKLWCEQPEVIRSGLLGTMNDQERKQQEAIFEVITSEASYLRSLDVLIEHFMDDSGMNPNLVDGRRVISKRQHHVVYSNVREIRQVSANFLHELRERQRRSTVIDNICDIINNYAEREFGCYISYCTNQVYQMREITEMLYCNTMFIDYIKRLESHKRCQNLSLTSFLLLPMQRITRLPLLVLAILNRLSTDHPLHSVVEDTLRCVQKLVTACNDGARQMERTEELHQIHSQLNFGKLKPFPLVSISRRLERKGSLVMLEIEQRLFGKPRIRKLPVYLFAFTDYILIAKRKKGPKGEIMYKVIDYASKAVVEMEKLKISKTITYPKHTFGEQETIARATWVVSSANEPHSFLLILLENSSQKSEKYVFVCQNDTECTRWIESISHPAKEKQKDDEKIYETWDCPQVQAVYDYTALQHDEISLVRGDIVKVLRKMADGWYEGEKLRDLQWGWFPSNFTMEIENAHTRARNLKERHRLLSTHLNTQQFSQQFSETVK